MASYVCCFLMGTYRSKNVNLNNEIVKKMTYTMMWAKLLEGTAMYGAWGKTVCSYLGRLMQGTWVEPQTIHNGDRRRYLHGNWDCKSYLFLFDNN